MISRTIAASLWKVSIILGVAIAVQSCTPKVATSSSASYKEDLSKYRPDLDEYIPLAVVKNKNDGDNAGEKISYPDPTNHLREEIDQIVDMTIDYNKSRNYVNGFSIQVYSGTEVREKDAVNLRVYERLGKTPKTTFDSPLYRTKVGRYYSRLEANKDMRAIKKLFPLAVIVSEKFKID